MGRHHPPRTPSHPPTEKGSSVNEHLEGRPISATTYQHHGCRCAGCRQAATEYQRLQRARPEHNTQRAINKAGSLAAQWVRTHHPDVWAQLLDQGYEHVGGRRRAGRRPKNSGGAA
jgi:hypothetical protein